MRAIHSYIASLLICLFFIVQTLGLVLPMLATGNSLPNLICTAQGLVPLNEEAPSSHVTHCVLCVAHDADMDVPNVSSLTYPTTPYIYARNLTPVSAFINVFHFVEARAPPIFS